MATINNNDPGYYLSHYIFHYLAHSEYDITREVSSAPMSFASV